MSLPIGHATMGFTAYRLLCGHGSRLGRWKVPLGILILSNLPDSDVVLGIVLQGNGSAFHRGPTHSLIFAFIAGYLASRVWGAWSQRPRLSFKVCFMLILCHILADAVFTNSPISFFWPVGVNWSGGHSGLRHVVSLVLFGNDQDVTIIFGCASLILLHRAMRECGTGILQKWLSYEREGFGELKKESLMIIHSNLASCSKSCSRRFQKETGMEPPHHADGRFGNP
jgi:hypothetical protein